MITHGKKKEPKFKNQYVILLKFEHGDADLTTNESRVLKNNLELQYFEELLNVYLEIKKNTYFIRNNFHNKPLEYKTFLHKLIKPYNTLYKKFQEHDREDTICEFLWLCSDFFNDKNYAAVSSVEMVYYNQDGQEHEVVITE